MVQIFQKAVQGIVNLIDNTAASLRLDYSMGASIATGGYGVTFGLNVANSSLYSDSIAAAQAADVSIVFVSDVNSEDSDNTAGLRLPGDQDAVISTIAGASNRTILVLNTNSAILMPWLHQVDAVLEAWYSGQQIGLAIANLLFSDVNPSGKLPMTFPNS